LRYRVDKDIDLALEHAARNCVERDLSFLAMTKALHQVGGSA
jgi:hypothetical protein